jgi:8-oxo-dGTP pyrophosphatase MutT (NUDIX family)
MLQKWKLLKSEWALHEKWYKVRKDTVEIRPGKIVDDYFMAISSDVAIVVAVTDDNMVPLVRQYKHGAGEILIELPAGYIDEEEEPLEAAKRELREETGYTATDWEKLTSVIRHPSKIRGDTIHIYLAKNAQKTAEQELDETEDIEVTLKPFAEAVRMAKIGELKGVDTVLGLLFAEEKLNKRRIRENLNF